MNITEEKWKEALDELFVRSITQEILLRTLCSVLTTPKIRAKVVVQIDTIRDDASHLPQIVLEQILALLPRLPLLANRALHRVEGSSGPWRPLPDLCAERGLGQM